MGSLAKIIDFTIRGRDEWRKSARLSLALLLMAAVFAPAETRLVPSHYATIQQAIHDSGDGDMVVVEPGTYVETINFTGKNIVVTSADPDNPEIVAATIVDGDGRGSVVTFENGETHEAVLTGFTVTGGYGTVNPLFGERRVWVWGAGIYCDSASPTIKGNVIANNNGPVSIEGNQVIAGGYGGAIGCIESDAIITQNVIRDNSAYAGAGIMTWLGAEPTFAGPTISNNLIYNNSAYVGGGAVLLYGGRLTNNTIVGNDASPLLATGAAGIGGNIYTESDPGFPPSQIMNNIVCNAQSGGGIFSAGLREDLRAFFNDVWHNAGGNYGVQNPYTGETRFDGPVDRTGTDGNISQEPLFVDLQGHDYHLRLDSPCMSAGDPGFVPELDQTDIDGEPRICGVGIDMGADEYVGPLRPVADAGPDQYVDTLRLVTLAGSVRFIYDACSVVTFEWNQLSGPAVELGNPAGMYPTFMPELEGEYRFELAVSDGINNSQPDEVLIIVRNRAPVADAGPDRSMSSLPVTVTLDGSGSYDPGGETLTYHWRQMAGPAVELSDESAVEPKFAPAEVGVFVFELVVNDGLMDSEPDVVGVVIGNRAPIADAGRPRYAAQDPVSLDGIHSFDPDGYGELVYHWRQVSGPSVNITDGNTATPTISGFGQRGAIQRCEFELTVSDGDLVSEPDMLELIIVPYFGNKELIQANPPFDPAKPTIVAFGGGDCHTGGPMTLSSFPDWYAKANFLTVRSSYGPSYYQYGDALIVYLSRVAPDYTQPIQTVGFSTGSMPAIDLAIHVNETYGDPPLRGQPCVVA